MPLQLEPGENFPITRQLDNPADTNTYYVKAIVRDAKTDDVLETVYLTDKGSQRFRGTWYVPYKAGPAYYITITSYVYTDSGYTTENDVYARQEDKLLVAQRWSQVFGGGGGSSIRVDYEKIRKMIKEEIKGVPKPEKVDLNSVTGPLTMLIGMIKAIKIPKMPKETDLNPVLKELYSIKKSFENIKMPEMTPPDLSPVIKKLEDVESKSEEVKDIKETLNTLVQYLNEIANEAESRKELKKVKESIKNLFGNEKLPTNDKPKRKLIV